jgi:hypothetical protein
MISVAGIRIANTRFSFKNFNPNKIVTIMKNFRSIFSSRQFLAAIFIMNSGITIGMTALSASASDLTTPSVVLVGEPVSVTYETSSGPQMVMSNEVYFYIQKSPSPQIDPPVKIQESPIPRSQTPPTPTESSNFAPVLSKPFANKSLYKKLTFKCDNWKHQGTKCLIW